MLTGANNSLALDWNPASGSFASTKGPTPTFSRASGATMVDVNGNVVWGPENLLLQSGDFTSSSWTKTGIAITTGQADPDGGNTAFLLTPNTANSSLVQPFTSGNVLPLTASIWLKSATGSNVSISLLLNSATGTDTFPIVITPTWQRFSVAGTAASANAVGNFYIGEFSTWSTGENIVAWHPQIERYASARAYIPTTTAPAYGPRITYDPVTHACLGYLSEEQRTNSILYSNDFLQVSNWGISSISLVASSTIGPDGLNSAYKLIESTANALHTLYQVGLPTGTQTHSVWVKPNGRTSFTMEADHLAKATFDLTGNGTATPSGSNIATIVKYPNGWFRCSNSGTASSAGGGIYMSPAIAGTGTYQGDGVSGVYIWGVQVEVGSFPTSYIPTTTAAVTRSADVCSISSAAFTSFYNPPEGTFVVESVVSQLKGSNRGLYSVDDNTQAHGFLEYYDEVIPGVSAQLRNASTNTIGIADQVTVGMGFKRALAFNATQSSSVHNGLPVETLVSPRPSETMTRFSIGTLWDTYSFNGTIARISYYKKRLPDADLIKLTNNTDLDAQAFIDSVTIAMGTPPTVTQRTAIDNFVKLEKSGGRWAKHKRIYLPIWENELANAICMKTLTTGTAYDMAPLPGCIQGDGGAAYFDTNTPINSVGIAAGDCHFWALSLEESYDVNTYAVIGTGNTFTGLRGISAYLAFYAGSGAVLLLGEPCLGVISGSRISGTSSLCKRTISARTVLATGTPAIVTTLPLGNVLVAVNDFDDNGNGILNDFSSIQFGGFGFGLGLTDAEDSAFTANIKTLWETCTGLTIP